MNLAPVPKSDREWDLGYKHEDVSAPPSAQQDTSTKSTPLPPAASDFDATTPLVEAEVVQLSEEPRVFKVDNFASNETMDAIIAATKAWQGRSKHDETGYRFSTYCIVARPSLQSLILTRSPFYCFRLASSFQCHAYQRPRSSTKKSKNFCG